MITIACLAGLLAALLAARATRPLRPAQRADDRGGHRRRRRAPPTDCAAALNAIARRVRSGSSLASAVVESIDAGSSLGVMVGRLAAGDSLVVALGTVPAGDADVALTIQALSAAAHLGGPIAATLDDAAAVLRDRAAARAERQAHSAQARLSARVLTIVPFGFALWTALSSDRTRAVYLSSAVGSVCAISGTVLNVAGWRWMRRIIGPAR